MARTSLASLTAREVPGAISGLDAERLKFVHDERSELGGGRAKQLTASIEVDGDLDRVSSRSLSRSIARQVSEKERRELHEERARLAWAEVMGALSVDQSCRLGIVRWILDRIEDAEIGPELDTLEKVAEIVESQAAHLANFARESRKYEQSRPFFSPGKPKAKR